MYARNRLPYSTCPTEGITFRGWGIWKGRRLRPCGSCRGPTRYATEDEIAGYASAVLKILELGDSLYRAGTRLEEAAVPPGYAM